MALLLSRIFLLAAIFATGTIIGAAQAAADNQSSVIPRPDENERDSRPRNIRESLEKMRIEREKKEYDRMVERSREAVKLVQEVETSLERKGQLTKSEIDKLEEVEKLAKQVRRDLGGGDDKEEVRGSSGSFGFREAVKMLRSSTEELFEEVKKTSRFTISAAAIHSSNAVLRLTRFLRFNR